MLLESKLRPPKHRPGAVIRSALLDRLEASTTPITTVVAPAGYGKSTLLGQWADRCHLPSTWLSLDRHDNDPANLLGHLIAALERIEPADPERRASLLAAAAVDIRGSLPRLAAWVSSMQTPFLFVLDHVEMVEADSSRDLIAVLALNLPDGSRLALGSRVEPPIPTHRLRANRMLDEVHRDDLTMDEFEAEALLVGAGVTPEPAEVSELVARTEGWPVGLYLASLSMRVAAVGIAPTRVPHGDERIFADYLREEMLSTLAPSTRTLLTRTSILDQFSGPLCDAVLGGSGAQEVLESLEASNMLLVPLDNQRHWYRCHHLLGELLRTELERTEPELVPRLHDRAATWFEANGQPAAALDHAQAAGDADRAARLFGRIGTVVHGSGRFDTVRRWLSWFVDHELIGRYPHVAVLGALADALEGAYASSRLFADAALAGDLDGTGPEGSPLRAWVAMMEALLCRRGVDQMRADATQATEQLSLLSPLRGPATTLAGLAALLQDDLAAADPLLAAAAELSLSSGQFTAGAAALAACAVLAIDRGDWDSASALSDQAIAIVEQRHLHAYPHAAGVFAVAARTAVHAGDVPAARRHVVASARLRPLCTAAIPWSAHFLVQLAYTYLALGDHRGARTVLRQVDDIVRASPDLGRVPAHCAEVNRMLETINAESVGASSLTVAELRLLPLLATHLTYKEIGERLHLSRNTIKSEAVSVLRKLGARSRGQAVDTAEQIGLLGH